MSIEIKMMETDDEIRGKAYVHWKAWHEAYPGIVGGAYLDGMTLAKCEKTAFDWPDNIIVAKDGGRVVGFSAYGMYADTSAEAGELFALYILEEYYGTGLGQRLLEAALDRLSGYSTVYLWVFRDNTRAVNFYKKHGFRPDGEEKRLESACADAIRMKLER